MVLCNARMGGRFSRDAASIPDSTSDGSGSRVKSAYKLVLVGDPAVGKTWIISRFVYDKMGPYNATIGSNYSWKKVELDGSEIKLTILDIGQSGSSFHKRTPLGFYFRAADGIMLVHDVTHQEMFDGWDWDWWIKMAEKACGKVPIILVGNKCDLTDRRVVEYERARDFADEKGMLYIEVSARDGTNVELAFVTLVAQIQEQKSNRDRTTQ